MTKLVFYNHCIICQYSWPTSTINDNFDIESMEAWTDHRNYLRKRSI